MDKPRLLSILMILSGALMGASVGVEAQSSDAVVAVHAPGAGGVTYKTDLLLTDLDSGDASCTLTLLDPAHATSTLVTVKEAEGVLAVPDVYDLLAPGVNGSGGLLVECSTAVGTTSRTYAEDSYDGSDLKGQSVHGFGLASQLTNANPMRILGVTQNAAFRTNLSLVNPQGSTVTVTVTRELGGASFDVAVGAASYTQVNSFMNSYFGVTDSADEAVRVSVASGGPVAAFGTLVDNLDGDFATLAAIAAAGSTQTLVLPALKNADLVTDLDLYNPGGGSVNATLTFSSGAFTAVALVPGATTYSDVLATLGVASGTGAIEVTSTDPLLAQARLRSTSSPLRLAALPAQVDLGASFVQRLGTYPSVPTATTVFSARATASGFLTLTPPTTPQPGTAEVVTYSIASSQVATHQWSVPTTSSGSVAELTTDNFVHGVSFLVSQRNANDLMVAPFHSSNVPRPVVEAGAFTCATGTTELTSRPDWSGQVWEWFAGGTTTGLTTQSIDGSPGIEYHVEVLDPSFADPGRSRPASLPEVIFCSGFETGDTSEWSFASP